MNRLSLVLALVMSGFLAFAQVTSRTITGTITDDEGEPLIGASVLIKGTSIGTVTDFDGNYSLTTDAAAPVLVVSYTGFGTQEVQAGDAVKYDITLDEGIEISEVVVTALGVERKKDDDLSSATLISADDIQRSGETGVIQGLAGKTSGVVITRNSGDPGAGAYIQIRGQNTILGDGSPLIILDGVPISNTSVVAGGNGAGNTANVVQQSRLNDLNPDDIASVTVLKGASAAAVYGTGAANGVLVITTKSGNVGGRRRFGVSVNSSVSFDQINSEHQKQSLYGKGSGGRFLASTNGFSWGDKIADRPGGEDVVDQSGAYFVGNQTGETYFPITTKNDRTVYNDVNRDQVFQTGLTADLSVGLNFNTDFSSTFLSFSRTDQEGVIRGNSDYERNTVRLNNKVQLLDNLDFRLNTSWSGISSNRIQSGSNLGGLYLGYLRTAPDFDNTDYDGLYFNNAGIPSKGHRSYRNQLGNPAIGPIYNNPGWTINNQTNDNEVNRFIISPEANWALTPGLTATVRYGLDYYGDVRRTNYPVLSAGEFFQGAYFRDDISERTQNVFAFLTGNYDLSDRLGFGFNVGYNIYDNQYSRNTSSTRNFLIDDPTKFITENAVAANQDGEQSVSHDRKNGVFGVFNFDYNDQLFLELTGRAERTATVPDQLFFFPSASLGYKVVDDANAGVSFAKLRASYGQIGIEPSLYVNRDVFFTATSGSEGWGQYYDGLNYGGTFRRGTTQGNPDLTIETVSEYEIGGDFRFLANRLALGVTYYDRTTEDAILPIEVPASSGYAQRYVNAATIVNSGVEVDASFRLYSSQDFSSRVFANFSRNRNIVERLPDVSRYFLDGFAGTSSSVVEGEAFGVLYGGRYERDEDTGEIVLDENGFPDAADEQGVIGDPNPDWRGGLGAEMTWKGLSFSFLFETLQGMDQWAGTYGVLHTFGIHPNTANESVSTEDLVNYAGTVIPAGTPFRGNIMDFGAGPVALDQAWYGTQGGGFGTLDEQFIFDASWTRLREVSLGYTLPSELLSGIGFNSINIGLTGRNLVFWSQFPDIDPDLNLTGASKGRGLEYFTNPTTRSYIINLNLGF